jgi:hypothetical protein
MKRKHILLLLVVLLVALIFAQSVEAMASENYALNWYTLLHSAGGGAIASSSYQADLTVGQTAIRTSTSPNYQIRLGYWVEMLRQWSLSLPLIQR